MTFSSAVQRVKYLLMGQGLCGHFVGFKLTYVQASPGPHCVHVEKLGLKFLVNSQAVLIQFRISKDSDYIVKHGYWADPALKQWIDEALLKKGCNQ